MSVPAFSAARAASAPSAAMPCPHGPLSVYVVPGRLRLSGRYAQDVRGKAVRLFHTGGTAVGIVTERTVFPAVATSEA